MPLDEELKTSQRASLLSIVLNAFLAGIKIVSGIFGRSHALLADGIESLTDVAGSIIVWFGVTISHQPPDQDHPRGHGRAETLASGFVAFSLLGAAIFIAFQSFNEIIHPRLGPKAFTLFILIGAIAIKAWLSKRIKKVGDEVKSLALKADALHHRADAITSIAAAVGISISLMGGKGYEKADSWAALIAAFIIAWHGLYLLYPVVAELMEKSPPREFLQRIRGVAIEEPGVDRIEKCFVRRMGKGFLIEMHMEVDPNMNVENAHELAHKVEERVRRKIANINDVVIHIEPFHGNS